MLKRTPTPEPLQVTDSHGESFTIVARPSGVIGWQYEASALPEGIPIAIAAALWNTLGRLVFRFGWSLVVYNNSDHLVARRRYRNKRTAMDHLPKLAEEMSLSGS